MDTLKVGPETIGVFSIDLCPYALRNGARKCEAYVGTSLLGVATQGGDGFEAVRRWGGGIHIYIYIYICVFSIYTYLHLHNIYVYIYIYIYISLGI